MANILDILNEIGTAIYGRDVRQAIIDAIRQCYEDGKAGVNDLHARTLIEAVMAVNEQQAAEIETLTARVEELEEGGSGGSSETSTTSVPTFLVESGTATFENVGANKTATQSIVFTKNFTEAPTVLAIKIFRQGANTFYSQVTAQPIQNSITTTGFTLAIGNKYTQAVSPSVLWVAFQPTTVEVETEITTVDGMTEADVRALLAPITAALNNLKIGYDGTEYDTPGASLREQINALHVLIGDEPGTAIQASAVAYEDSNVADELTGINGRLGQLTSAIGTTTVHSETVDDNVTQGIVYRKNGGQIEHTNALSIKHTVADGETACKFSGYTWSNTNVAALIAFDANMSMLDYYGETVGKYENIEYTYPTGTKTIVVNGITSPALMPLLTVYSTTEEITDVGERFERIEATTIDVLKSLNIACDGDSTTGEGAQEDRKSWFSYALAQTGYGTRKNVGCGNAFAKDRTSNTSGTTFYPQWKPSVGSAWVDYYGLSDPNYAGSEGTYISGTEAFDQATANNCLYSHIGYYVDGVNNGLWPAPDVFIIAMSGTNDLWRDTEQRTINALGTFEDAITGDWSALTRDNILKSIRWAVQFMRATYPNCLIFFKTATQKCKETHPYFYIAEEPILKMCKYLSVPVIDSYGELGINAEFEHRPANNNQWTSDGVHPTDAGYKKEGRFVAKMLLNNYRPNA